MKLQRFEVESYMTLHENPKTERAQDFLKKVMH